MIKTQNLTHPIHQPAWLEDEFLHKHLPVCWIIVARLYRYFPDNRANMARYNRKIPRHVNGTLSTSYASPVIEN